MKNGIVNRIKVVIYEVGGYMSNGVEINGIECKILKRGIGKEYRERKKVNK
jgi:hypothetical protein